MLISVVLAIGGCLPCQNLFAGEPPSKSCCNSKGECQRPNPENPNKTTCKLPLADIQSEPQPPSDLVVGGDPVFTDRSYLTFASYQAIMVRDASPAHSSPPALFLLNLSLLI
ncbi:MAG TPA: hypothetical protein VM120_09550 [Bryobacteraceae bacterium]|nr:hypothetical protein [Bryobacteraceae bacterium]